MAVSVCRVPFIKKRTGEVKITNRNSKNAWGWGGNSGLKMVHGRALAEMTQFHAIEVKNLR